MARTRAPSHHALREGGALLLLLSFLLFLLVAFAPAAAQNDTAAPAPANATTTPAPENASKTTPNDPFAAAPRCPSWPRASTSTRDKEGRLWGFAQGTSCAFKTPDGQLQQLDAWETALACGDTPTPSSTTADRLGRLWGWDSQQSRSCAYKEQGSSRPRFFDTYEPGDWLSTPPCPGAQAGAAAIYDPSWASTDSQFKTWSWSGFADAPRLCAEKDDRQAPLPPRPSEYVRLSFLDAPACGGSETSPSEEPSAQNSRPDRDGFLWGWWRARPCAWKKVTRDQETGRVAAVTPLYYSGYSGPRAAVENEQRMGGPSSSSSSSSSNAAGGGGGSAINAPPENSSYRYARSGLNGPIPSLGSPPSPAPAPP